VNGKNVSGELITHTSGGGIHLSEMSCSLEASNSGGGIDIEIKELGKYVKISNSGGSIDLQLPKNKGVDLDLSGGRIKTGQLGNFDGKIEVDRLRDRLRSGSTHSASPRNSPAALFPPPRTFSNCVSRPRSSLPPTPPFRRSGIKRTAWTQSSCQGPTARSSGNRTRVGVSLTEYFRSSGMSGTPEYTQYRARPGHLPT